MPSTSSSKLLRLIWLVMFASFALLLGLLLPVAGVLLMAAGAGRAVTEFVNLQAGLLLLVLVSAVAAALASVVTVVVAILMYVLRRDPSSASNPPEGSTRGPGGSMQVSTPGLISARAIGADGQPLPLPGAWQHVGMTLVPAGGLGMLIAASALAWFYLHPPGTLLYATWQWLEYVLPTLAVAGWVAGVVLAIRCHRRERWSLPRSWRRFRIAASIASSLLVWHALAYRDQACDMDIVTGLVRALNPAGLQRYLDRRASCGKLSLASVMQALGSRDVFTESQSGQPARAPLDTLVAIDRWTWKEILEQDDPDLLDAQLRRVKQTHREPAEAFAVDALRDPVKQWVSQSDPLPLRRLIAAGLRFDRPGWRQEGETLLELTLESPRPSWDFYDELVAAGLTVSPSLEALVKGMRTGSTEPTSPLTQRAWWTAVDAGNPSSMDLITFALFYTNDARLRAGFMAQAGVNQDTALARIAVPSRCLLGNRFKAEAILASLGPNDDKARCASTLQSTSDLHTADPLPTAASTDAR